VPPRTVLGVLSKWPPLGSLAGKKKTGEAGVNCRRAGGPKKTRGKRGYPHPVPHRRRLPRKKRIGVKLTGQGGGPVTRPLKARYLPPYLRGPALPDLLRCPMGLIRYPSRESPFHSGEENVLMGYPFLEELFHSLGVLSALKEKECKVAVKLFS